MINHWFWNLTVGTRHMMKKADIRLLIPKLSQSGEINPPPQFREKNNFLQKSTFLIINYKKVLDKRIKSIMWSIYHMGLSKLFILIPRWTKSVEYFLIYWQKCAWRTLDLWFQGYMHEIFKIVWETSTWAHFKDNFMLKNKLKICIALKSIFYLLLAL